MGFAIMIVDDNPDHAALATMCLEQGASDIEVSAVSGGAEAIAAFAAGARPDLVLLDLNMPGVSGFDVLSAVREMDALATLPIVVVSSSAMARDVERAMRLRANSYSVKSSDFETWGETLRAVRNYWRDVDRGASMEMA